MKQNEMMTENEAIKMAISGWWKDKTATEIVDFQLYQSRLCMPFEDYSKAVQVSLNRYVARAEYEYPELLDEEYKKVMSESSREHRSKICADYMVRVALENSKDTRYTMQFKDIERKTGLVEKEIQEIAKRLTSYDEVYGAKIGDDITLCCYTYACKNLEYPIESPIDIPTDAISVKEYLSKEQPVCIAYHSSEEKIIINYSLNELMTEDTQNKFSDILQGKIVRTDICDNGYNIGYVANVNPYRLNEFLGDLTWAEEYLEFERYTEKERLLEKERHCAQQTDLENNQPTWGQKMY